MATLRALYVVGPTAVGKTSLAIAAAERMDGEIVSCDSRQIFRGMAIGTAQPTPAEQARVRHHLVAVADPREGWSAGAYARAAVTAIAEIAARGKAVIIAGGSGLYVEALREGLDEIPKDAEVRASLEARLRTEGESVLFDELLRIDPLAAAKIHPRNHPRLVRALEVHAITGKPLSAFWGRAQRPPAAAPLVVLDRERERLYRRIDARVAAMVEAGWQEEVARLLEAGFDESWPSHRTLGYPEMAAVVRGELSEAEAIERISRDTRRFARRQLTWLRSRYPDAPRIDLDEVTDPLGAILAVEEG